MSEDRPKVRFDSHDDFLEMGATIEDDAQLQSLGDAYVTVLVQANGFRGHNDLWVQRESLEGFATQLAALSRNLSGEARLSGASPNELELVIRAMTSRGHVAVSGSTGDFVQCDNGRHWHSISFGFEFELGQMEAALRNSWLSQYVDVKHSTR